MYNFKPASLNIEKLPLLAVPSKQFNINWGLVIAIALLVTVVFWFFYKRMKVQDSNQDDMKKDIVSITDRLDSRGL